MRLFLFCCFILSMQFGFAQQDPKVLIDSALSIYKTDPKAAIPLYETSLELAIATKSKFQQARAKNGLALVYRDLGDLQKAIDHAQQAMTLTTDSIVQGSALNTLGVAHRQLGHYEESLKYYLKSLDIYIAKKDQVKEATVTNNIGLVYSYLGINDKAIEYHLKAKSVFEALNNQKGISEVYNNIAIIYANDGNLEKALDYFKYSLEIETEIKDKKGIAESANNVGAVYYYMQEIDSALAYFQASVKMEREIGNFAGVGATYNNIADLLMENNRINDSKPYIDSSYHYAQKSKVRVDIESALLNYSKYYEAKGQEGLALDYYKQFSRFRDSTLNLETNSKIAELEIEFQTEKKEKEILMQRTNLAEKELDINRKNYYILGLVALAVVLLLLGYLLYSQQKLKNRQLKRENELKEAMLQIETQNKLQDQRLRISRDLHDNIGAQLTFIISSLDNLKYGFKLPEKLDDKLKTISTFTSSTINELRDTIWAMNKNDISLEDLRIRISNLIKKANVASNDVAFNISFDDAKIDQLKFTSVQGMNIYRIIQEGINNALKYANAQQVNVRFYRDAEHLVFKVVDDGHGFDIGSQNLGNGLHNMKKRAQDIGAEINIDSKSDQGTTITLKLETNKI